MRTSLRNNPAGTLTSTWAQQNRDSNANQIVRPIADDKKRRKKKNTIFFNYLLNIG